MTKVSVMKFAMTKMATGLVLAGFSVSASAASISSTTITSGAFAMDDPTATITFFYIGPNTNLVGGYIGDSLADVAASGANPEDIVSFMFFGKPFHVYTAAENYGDMGTPAGMWSGGPVPTGTITGNTMTLDLSSWFANWKQDIPMGGVARCRSR